MFARLIFFVFKAFRFFLAFLYYKTRIFFGQSLFFQRFFLNVQLVWSYRAKAIQSFYHLVQFFSEFTKAYSVVFWFRFGMIISLYPLKLVFASLLYPMFSTYFYMGTPLYIVFMSVCSLIYFSILSPSFYQTLKEGDLYVFCTIQMILIEASFVTPVTYYYCEPFLFDAAVMMARSYDLFGQFSAHPLQNLFREVNEEHIEEEELIPVRDVFRYSELKPVFNEAGPGQLYKIRTGRYSKSSLFENARFVRYYFSKYHSGFSRRKQLAFQKIMWLEHEVLMQYSPYGRTMFWKSNLTPYMRNSYWRFPVYSPFMWAMSDDPNAYASESHELDPPFAKRCAEYLKGLSTRKAPDYLFNYYLIKASATASFRRRTFERELYVHLKAFESDVNTNWQKPYSVRTFFDAPGMSSGMPERNPGPGFYVHLRAERVLDGIRLAPTLETARIGSYKLDGNSSTAYHSIFSSYEDYNKNKALKVLETWSAFFSERYPVSFAPLLELDLVFANSLFKGLVILFDLGNPDYSFFGELLPDEANEYKRVFDEESSYYSLAQRDFSPTYNLDILEFVKKLPAYHSKDSIYQFTTPCDLWDYTARPLDETAFRVLTMYGRRGIIFRKFWKYSLYRKLLEGQWYVFTKERMYNPLTGEVSNSIGTTVYTWKATNKWVANSQFPSVMYSGGITGRSRLPLPSKYYIPFAQGLKEQGITVHNPQLDEFKLTRAAIMSDEHEFLLSVNTLPLQLNKWSEPAPITSFEIVQNGRLYRRRNDYRILSREQHKPVSTHEFKFDLRGKCDFAFFPRFFESTFHKPYFYVKHRSFEKYKWPKYKNVNYKLYPRIAVGFRWWLLDEREPWEQPETYIRKGYHPKVPKYLLQPRSYDITYRIASRIFSWVHTLGDKCAASYENWSMRLHNIPNYFTKRYFSYIIYSNIHWGRMGKNYALRELSFFWPYLNREWLLSILPVYDTYCRLSVFIMQAYYLSPGGIIAVNPAHDRYFREIFSLLETYFNEYSLSIPLSVRDRVRNAPVEVWPVKDSANVRGSVDLGPRLVPDVLLRLQKIALEYFKNIEKAEGSAGLVIPLHQHTMEFYERSKTHNLVRLRSDLQRFIDRDRELRKKV